MAFGEDETLWDQFLAAWPLERLRTMTLPEYTTSGDPDSFIYWLEFRLGDYGSIAGGSAFKFGIFSRRATEDRPGDATLAYDTNYGWYRRFGATPEEAFETIREHVAAVAEAARAGRLEDIDKSPLGAAYRWKIGFHYQPRTNPTIPCIFVRKPLLHALRLALSDTTTPQSTLYRSLSAQRAPGESIVAFSERTWRDFILSNPCIIRLTKGAIDNGYLPLNLVSAPFPESMYGGTTDNEAGEVSRFRTDTGLEFESDIYTAGGGSGRLRKRLGAYFADIGAAAGDTISITQAADGTYVLTSKLGSPVTVPAPITSAPTPVPAKAQISQRAPMNQILFGPPGTGKTYHAIERALEILAPELLADVAGLDPGDRRKRLKERFDELAKEGLVEFVTFHQSFSYEDFVEGIQATTDEETKQIRYEVADGVFKRLCDAARTRSVRLAQTSLDFNGRRTWKWSLGDAATEQHIYDECIAKGIALMGFGAGGNFSQCATREDVQKVFARHGEAVGLQDYPVTAIWTLLHRMKIGDLVVVSEGNLKFRAIGEITGHYRRINREEDTYVQSREVRWLRVYEPALPYTQLMNRKFSQMTVYEPGSIDQEKLRGLLAVEIDPGEQGPRPRVLIIDEINRGNVSRVFGELITLLEPSKRAGQDEALEVVLPYSKERFSVPDNVYLIGTMNTADRSLAGMDIALRRRFTFTEMAPDPGKLAGVRIEGIDVAGVLEIINRRIEVLLDRDHQIGHAYLMTLKNGDPLSTLGRIFRNQIIPLLQEYFFEDWERIAWVLNDHRKPLGSRFLVAPAYSPELLFGRDVQVPVAAKLWRIDERAFENAEAYVGIVDATPG